MFSQIVFPEPYAIWPRLWKGLTSVFDRLAQEKAALDEEVAGEACLRDKQRGIDSKGCGSGELQLSSRSEERSLSTIFSPFIYYNTPAVMASFFFFLRHPCSDGFFLLF